MIPNPGTRIHVYSSRGQNGVSVVDIYLDVISAAARGKCPCGSEVDLAGFTNTCANCNRDFNISGSELAPREQWGLDTGESVSDILAVDYNKDY